MDLVEEYSKKIKQDADELLQTTGLINSLKEFGEVVIGGSYKYDLMWDPDIDMVVICDDPRTKSVEALHKMVDLRLFQKYEYGDFAKFKRQDRPESYIVNLILPFCGQKWEIEVWFMEEYPPEQIGMDELMKYKLNDKNRKTILQMKKSRAESGYSKHDSGSIDIYRRVLNHQ